ncbi:MAG: hypothetical protein U9O94_11480 [Nanoarchaeota archaeon]|nr:hypothetical protein [Nanoarchaeota archaeon]
MPMNHFFSSMRFGTELMYTVIIVFLCFLIYYKTKEIYDLTKHKGIHYFRNTFLFFGLAYASRFFLYLFLIAGMTMDIYFPRRIFMPLTMVPVSYLSTIAIFYLAYSLIWKKIKYRNFIVFSNTLAILVSLVALTSKSHIIVSFLQLLLLVFAVLIITAKKHKKVKINVRALYLLVSLFWLLNLFVLGSRRFLSLEVKIVFQLISVVVFIVIYYKVNKWIK